MSNKSISDEIKKIKRDTREATIAEIIVATQPLLNYSYWAEKLGYQDRRWIFDLVKKYYPETIGVKK